MPRLGPLLALLLPGAASAAWPEDVDLEGMVEFDGDPVDDVDVLSSDYRAVIRQLGAVVASPTLLAPRTLGMSEFEVVVESNLAFTQTNRPGADGSTPPWFRVHRDEDPQPFQFTPGITVRKGLPFSLEIGMTGRWLGGTRQGVVGGFIRGAPVENLKPWPDLNIHLAYTGYVGNDQLELGVLDFGGTLGSTWWLGPEGGLKSTKISTYADISMLAVYASPTIDAETALAIGATGFGGPSPAPDDLPSQGPQIMARFSAGFEIVAGHYLIRVSGGYTLDALGHVAVATGFVY